jgi:soluble lytic murein transglycosylase-like protein
MGIGQLMPDTVTWLNEVVMRTPLSPGDPSDNIRMSARYLRWLLDRTGGDPAVALAGYYQGLAAVRSSGVFPSTTAYVDDVLSFRDRHF